MTARLEAARLWASEEIWRARQVIRRFDSVGLAIMIVGLPIYGYALAAAIEIIVNGGLP